MEKKIIVNENESKILTTKTTSLSEEVYALQIVDAVSCSKANELVKACTSLEGKIKGFYAPVKSTAKDLHQQICDMEKVQLKPVSEMKSFTKNQMSEFIAEEEAYNDGVHTFTKTLMVAEGFDNNLLGDYQNRGDYFEAVELCQEALKKDRADIDPFDYKETADWAMGQVQMARYWIQARENVVVEEPEIKKPKTNLRKLSLSHEISVSSMKKLIDAVAFGEVPMDWLMVNESAMKRDAKQYETAEAFYKKYPTAGVMLKITRGIR